MMSRCAALTVLAISLTACAAAPPAEAPPQPAEPMPQRFVIDGAKGPSEVDKHMLAIAKSEEEIDRLFPHAGKDKDVARKKSAPPADAKPADKATRDEAQSMAGGDACATACRALASMQTSADHLCKLAGEGDGRCEDARGRVRGASARVRSACPTCTAGAK